MEKWHETCKRNPVSGLNWTILYHPRSKCPGHSGRCRGSTCRVFPLCRCAKLVPLTENWVPLRRANVKSDNKPLGFHNFCKAPARPPANCIHIYRWKYVVLRYQCSSCFQKDRVSIQYRIIHLTIFSDFYTQETGFTPDCILCVFCFQVYITS